MLDWERYQFLRYYLPGFLFFTYLAILLIPAIKNLQAPSVDGLVSVFGAVIIASPVIGYLIYSAFNYLYEYLSCHCDRPAFVFIENAEFAEDPEKTFYREKFAQFVKQKELVHIKELIDLTLHLDYVYPKGKADAIGEPDATVNPQALSVLQSQLNNFSARVVCGFFTPIASSIVVVIIALVVAPNAFSLINNTLVFSIILIVVASISLLIGTVRVLKEAFVLENYIVRSRKRELRIIIKRIFPIEQKKKSTTCDDS